jgi:hypothetical protein
MVMQATSDGPTARAEIKLETPFATDPHQIGRMLGPESVGHHVGVPQIRAGSPLTVGVTVTGRPAR